MPDRDRAAERAVTEREIDALYQRPLTEFTTARNELAKALSKAGARDDAARVKALEKPTVTPWAVNQVYWQARSIWDRLMTAGATLRTAQVDALERPGATDSQVQRARDRMRDATEAHRSAIADAVHQAIRAASLAGVNPAPDQLSRMLESISLAATPPAAPGRFTEMIQPAGFEALFGVVPVGALPRPAASAASARPALDPASVPSLDPTMPAGVAVRGSGKPAGKGAGKEATSQAARAAEKAAQKEAAQEAARRHAARVQAATEALAQARTVERDARQAESLARDRVHDAELTLRQARTALADAESATRKAAEARADAESALDAARHQR